MAEQLATVAGVLVLLIATVFLLSRRGAGRFNFQRGGGARNRKLEVVERLPLTPQHSLHLVRLEGRLLLLGVSPAGCNLLQNDVALNTRTELEPR